MGLVDKLQSGADEAALRARGTVQDTQARRELGHAYGELGRAAYALAEEGALTIPRLGAAVERVRELERRLASADRTLRVDPA